jgi:quinol monooxygenase YgiN
MQEPAAIVKMVATPGREDELLELLTSMAAIAVSDEGTEVYAVHRGRAEPSTFFLYELYRDKDALARHRNNTRLTDAARPLSDMTESVEVITGNLVAGDRAVRVAGGEVPAR